MRVVVAGWVNSPHVTAWVEMLMDLDYEVTLVGHRAPGLPDLALPTGLSGFEELALGNAPLIRSLQLGRALQQAVRRVAPDLVHAHWLPEYGWFAARASLHPLVCSAWGSDALMPSRIGRPRTSAAIRGADLVLADSAPLAAAVRDLVPDAPPVVVFHPGVDLARFRPGDRAQARAALGWPAEAPVVLSPRAQSPLYNHEVIIRAFTQVAAAVPGARLVLKHPEERLDEHLAEVIAASGLAGSVDVVGSVEPSLMPAIYQAADIVISVPSSDSSPATAWEALACGRPLIVSDLQWARDELTHAETAWVVQVIETAITDGAVSLLTDRGLAEKLGTNGRQLAEKQMNRRDHLEELNRLYRDVVEANRR
jgi:glycosyltransferase involved in cell wall biosynthesis